MLTLRSTLRTSFPTHKLKPSTPLSSRPCLPTACLARRTMLSETVNQDETVMQKWKGYLYEQQGPSWKAAQFVDQTFTGISQVIITPDACIVVVSLDCLLLSDEALNRCHWVVFAICFDLLSSKTETLDVVHREHNNWSLLGNCLSPHISCWRFGRNLWRSFGTILGQHPQVEPALSEIRYGNQRSDFLYPGLYAFNSILVVACLNAFVTPLPAVVGLSVLGSLGTVVLFDKGSQYVYLCQHFLTPRKFSWPVVSIPFLIVADAALLAVRAIPSASAIQFSMPPPISLTMFSDFVPFVTSIATTIPLTFSQLFFTFNFWGGVAIILSAIIGDKRTILSGACGAAIGSTVGFFLGFDVSDGLWGFNSALTAMALYPTFGIPFWGALGFAGVTALLQPLAMAIFGFFGLPALSFSFCVTTITALRFSRKNENTKPLKEEVKKAWWALKSKASPYIPKNSS